MKKNSAQTSLEIVADRVLVLGLLATVRGYRCMAGVLTRRAPDSCSQQGQILRQAYRGLTRSLRQM